MVIDGCPRSIVDRESYFTFSLYSRFLEVDRMFYPDGSSFLEQPLKLRKVFDVLDVYVDIYRKNEEKRKKADGQ